MQYDENYFSNLLKTNNDKTTSNLEQEEEEKRKEEVVKKTKSLYDDYFSNLVSKKSKKIKKPINQEQEDYVENDSVKVKNVNVVKDTPVYLSDFLMNKWASTSPEDEKLAYVDYVGKSFGIDPYKTRLDQLDTTKLAQSMATFEGYYNEIPEGEEGTRAQRNNNPGNLAYYEEYTGPDGILNKAIDTDGEFAIFKNPEDGFDAMHRQIELDKQRAAEKYKLDNMSSQSLEGIIPSYTDLQSLEGINQQREDRFNKYPGLGTEIPSPLLEYAELPVDMPFDEVGNAEIPFYGYEYNAEKQKDEKLILLDGNGKVVTDEKILKQFFTQPEPDEFGMFPPSFKPVLENQGYRAANLESKNILLTTKEKDDIIKYEQQVLEQDTGIHSQIVEAYEKADGNKQAMMFNEVAKHVGYRMAGIASLGISRNFMNKPIITKILDGNLTGIEEVDMPTDKTRQGRDLRLARALNGVGGFVEAIAHLQAFMFGTTVGLTKLGLNTPGLANTISFMSAGAVSRATDTNNTEKMTAAKWFSYTAADGIMGYAFRPLQNIGGPLLATEGGYIKVFSKLLAQSGVLTAGMTGTQFGAKVVNSINDNPNQTLKEAVIDAAGNDEFKLENLLYNMTFMTVMNALSNHKRFYKGDALPKTTALVKGFRAKWSGPVSTKNFVGQAEQKAWFNSLSGAEKAKIYNKQMIAAKSIADKWFMRTKTTIDPKTGKEIQSKTYIRYNKPTTVNDAQAILNNVEKEFGNFIRKPKAQSASKTSPTNVRETKAAPSLDIGTPIVQKKPLAIAESPRRVLERLGQTKLYRQNLLDQIGARDYKVQVLDSNIDALVTPQAVSKYKKDSLKELNAQKAQLKILRKQARLNVRKNVEGAKQDLDEINKLAFNVENQIRGLKGLKLKSSPYEIREMKRRAKEAEKEETLVQQPKEVEASVVKTKDTVVETDVKKKTSKPLKTLESKLNDLNQFQNILASEKLQKQVDVYDLMELAQKKGVKVTPNTTKTDALSALFNKMHKGKTIAPEVKEQVNIVREKQRGGYKKAEEQGLIRTLNANKKALETGVDLDGKKLTATKRKDYEISVKATERLLEFKKVNESKNTALEDSAGKALDRLSSNLNINKRFASDKDPNYTLQDKINDASLVGAELFIRGFNSAKSFTKEMTRTFGKSIKAYIKKIWKKAKQIVKDLAEKGVERLEGFMARTGTLKYVVEPAKKGTPNIRKVTYEGEPQGVVILGADMVARRGGKRFAQGLRWTEEKQGFAVGKNIATQLQKQADAGNNVVAIMGYKNLLGSMQVNPEFQNRLKELLGKAVGKRAFNRLMKEKEGNLSKVAGLINKEIQIYNKTAIKKKEKVNQSDIARWIGEPDASQLAAKIVYVGQLKEQRLGDARIAPHETYPAEQIFKKGTFRELENKLSIYDLVESMPVTRFSGNTRRSWGMDVQQNGLLVLKKDSDLAKALVEAGSGGKDAFKAKGEAPIQFSSPATKETMTPEEAAIAMKGERSREFARFNSDLNTAFKLKSNTREAVGYTIQYKDENSLVDRYVEGVPDDLLRLKGAVMGLVGNQKDIVNFKPNPKGPHKLYKVTIPAKALPEIKKTFIELGVESKSLVPKGQVVDAYVWDDTGKFNKNIIKGVADYYGTGYKEARGKFESITGTDNRRQAIKTYIDILGKNPKKYNEISRLLKQRLPIFYSKKEAQKIIDRIEGTKAEYIKSLGGLEAGFLGMTPQNFKLVKNTLIDTGTFTYKQLSKGTRVIGEKLGVNADNFKQKFSEYANNPKNAPAKLKAFFKKVWNQMKGWWKNNRDVIMTNPLVNEISKIANRMSGRMYFVENMTPAEIIKFNQKQTFLIKQIKDRAIKEGLITDSAFKAMKKQYFGTESYSTKTVDPQKLLAFQEGLNQQFFNIVPKSTQRPKDAVKPETFRDLQNLKNNLVQNNKLTESQYYQAATDLGIKSTHYINRNAYLKESEAKELTRSININRKRYQEEILLNESLDRMPQLKQYYKYFENNNNKLYGKSRAKGELSFKRSILARKYFKTDIAANEFADMQHVITEIQDMSGVPIARTWKRLIDNSDRIKYKTTQHINNLAKLPEFNRIFRDKSIDKEMELYIRSKGKEGKLSQSEEVIGDYIIKGLRSFEKDIRKERAIGYAYGQVKSIPDAPKEDLAMIKKLYKTEGIDAVIKFAKDKTWGVKKDYSLREFLDPGKAGIGSFTRRDVGKLSERHLNARTESNTDIDRQKTQVQLYTQYYKRISKRLGIKEDLMEYAYMWENSVSPMFKDRATISNWIGANIDEILQNPEPISGAVNLFNNVSSQFSLSIFANFEMTFRNLMQVLPMNPNNINMIQGIFKGLMQGKFLNESDRKYFRENVDKSYTLQADIMGFDYTNQLYTNADYKYPTLAKAMLDRKNGISFNPVRFLNNTAQHLNLIGISDKFGRFASYLGSITRSNAALSNFNINTANRKELSKFIIKTDLNNMTEGQRQHAIFLLATEGPDAFKQYVAKEHAVYVNMDYERDKRAPFEQGSQMNRLMGQMTTYFRGQMHQLNRLKKMIPQIIKDLKKENRNKKGYNPNAWEVMDKVYIIGRNLAGTFFGMDVANTILSKVTGEDKKDYTFPFTNIPIPLGISAGVVTKLIKNLNFLVQASIGGNPYVDNMNQKTKIDKVAKTFTSMPKEAIPFVNEALDVLDVFNNTELIEQQVFKEMVEAFDKRLIEQLGIDTGEYGRYVAPLPKKVRRNLVEKLQKSFLGTEKQKEDAIMTY